MRKLAATLFMLASLSVGFVAATSAPAAAEENLYDGTSSVWAFRGEFQYNVKAYPSISQSFMFYPNSYVEFDAVNGQYWQIEGPRYNKTTDSDDSNGRLLLGFGGGTRSMESFTVKFYAPDGSEIATAKDPKLNCVYSFPRNGQQYDRVKVRIESRSPQNFDAKFFVWSPVNPVMAKPIE